MLTLYIVNWKCAVQNTINIVNYYSPTLEKPMVRPQSKFFPKYFQFFTYYSLSVFPLSLRYAPRWTHFLFCGLKTDGMGPNFSGILQNWVNKCFIVRNIVMVQRGAARWVISMIFIAALHKCWRILIGQPLKKNGKLADWHFYQK